MSLLHPACIRSFGWLCDWDWVSPVSPVSPSFFSSFMPSSSRSSSAKLFFGKQPMPCLPRNVKRRFGIWFSHKCQVQSQHLPTMEATGQTWGGFVQISHHLENTGKSMRTICYIHQMPWAPRPAKLLGPNLHKKWTLCLWLETWGIYLVNQYVICTQPVLCKYRPILWNGVS